MRVAAKTLVAIGLLVTLTACNQHRTSEYYEQRPPVDTLHPDDSGLQSKDIVGASESVGRDLLAEPQLRQSPTQWLLVVDKVDDMTTERYFNHDYQIFLERLRGSLARYGKGQVTLIENRAKLEQLRGRELDNPGAAPARTLPQYSLYCKAMDFPNRRTNYYLLSFTVTDLKSGIQVWTGQYEVKAKRD